MGFTAKYNFYNSLKKQHFNLVSLLFLELFSHVWDQNATPRLKNANCSVRNNLRLRQNLVAVVLENPC